MADSDQTTIDVAISDAHTASRTVAETTAEQRVAWLAAISDTLARAAGELINVADTETALGATRLTSELGRTRAQLDLFAAVLRDGSYLDIVVDTPDSLPPGSPSVHLRRMLHPIGPVAVWAASNFPFAFGVTGTDTVSALAAGCPVLVKSHPSQPATSVALADVVARALRAAGAPEGTFAALHGPAAGDALIDDPRIRAAAFTGSLQGGRVLFDRACARPQPIPFYGELGSLNPVFVTAAAVAARSEAIVDGFVTSLTAGTGQFCTKPGVLFMPRGCGLLGNITDRVTAAASGPMLNQRMRDTYLRVIDDLTTAARDAARIWGGRGEAPAEGFWAAPTVLTISADAFNDRFDQLAEECFGPFALLVEYDRPDELPQLAARFIGSLTGTVHAEPADDRIVAELIAVLRERAGRIIYNGWPTGVAVGWAMHHGGPYPATTAPAATSVGARAIGRFLRPTTYQDVPDRLLPHELRTR
jgi:NADP-dependent aldehyde dehydrogenase